MKIGRIGLRAIYHRIFKLFYILIAISGLIWQVTLISTFYFKYEALSEITIISTSQDILIMKTIKLSKLFNPFKT